MREFFSELKRRHIYRVAAAYAVVGWVLLQLVNNVAPALRLPEWAATLVIVLLAVGFPVALLFCWIQQLAPAGSAAEHVKTNRLDWILAGGLAAVIAIFLFQELALNRAAPPQQQGGVPPAQTVAASPAGGISIAVLPFANLSGDVSQEFFSDGVTEEITAALAKIPGLRVVARTSAFAFKGQNQDMRAIGQSLGASHLIEGSVRKAGDRVRITAQLIKAADGTHLWTENYDRQLTDIFATQENIAQAIAGALRVPLDLQGGRTLVTNRTTNAETYQQFLQARAFSREQKPAEAIAVLEPVVAGDPNFAPAWAFLARAYLLRPFYTPAVRAGPVQEAHEIAQSDLAKARMAAEQAVRLDPQLAVAHAMLAASSMPGGWSGAEEIYRQALALDANDPETLHQYSSMLANVGRLKDALRYREQLRALEPFAPAFNMITAYLLQAGGQTKDAVSILKALPSADPLLRLFRDELFARIAAAEGRYSEAADIVLAIPANDLVSKQSISDAAQLLRQAPTRAKAPEALPALDASLSFAYAYVGATDRMMDWPARNVEIGYFGATYVWWLPDYAPARKTERFKALMRRAGLVDYWRAKGWPDLCKPQGADDFVCE